MILGIWTEVLSTNDAVALLDARFAQRQSTRVAFLNAHTAVMSEQDPAFRALLCNFTVFNDGIGLDLASLLKYGLGYPSNLNGTDFIPHYLGATQNRFRIFLLGAVPEAVEATAKQLSIAYPRHEIVGACDGYSYRDKNITALIREKQADLILVAMGNPLQEFWISENLEATGAMIAMGVGGFFNFAAGFVPRAPKFLRLLRSEWLFRLYCEPKRLWRRYLIGNFKFIGYALRDAAKHWQDKSVK